MLARLESFAYRDTTGVFAITPSAKLQSLSGIDGYAAPADYNGLTLMLLDLAAQAWKSGGDSGAVPTVAALGDGGFDQFLVDVSSIVTDVDEYGHSAKL